MEDKIVSIIVPVYNQEMYLRKSIPSLLEQDYRNIQIVIVNENRGNAALTSKKGCAMLFLITVINCLNRQHSIHSEKRRGNQYGGNNNPV